MTGKPDERKVDVQVMPADELEDKLAWFARMAEEGKTRATKGG